MEKIKTLWNILPATFMGIPRGEWAAYVLLVITVIISARTGSVGATIFGALIGACVFIVVDHVGRTRISVISLIAIVITACFLVIHVQPVDNFLAWFAAKIMFVAFFGLFGGHLLALIHGRGGRALVFLLLGLGTFFFAFLMKTNGWLDYPENAVYKWNDLAEDLLFGISSLFYAVIIPLPFVPTAASVAVPTSTTTLPTTPAATTPGAGTAGLVSAPQDSQGNNNSTT